MGGEVFVVRYFEAEDLLVISDHFLDFGLNFLFKLMFYA